MATNSYEYYNSLKDGEDPNKAKQPKPSRVSSMGQREQVKMGDSYTDAIKRRLRLSKLDKKEGEKENGGF